MKIPGEFAILYKKMIKNIPINNFIFRGNEKKYLTECIDSGWISHEGPFVEKFETQFSNYIGRKYGIAVSSGSAALDIAVVAAGIKKGDEVIMPALTIISPALSVVKAGAVPVLVDSHPDTFNMNVDEIESKITSKTKAIIIVHLYGLPVIVDELLALAKKYDLKIIEDAAEMHGQTYDGKKCGTFGDISVFSFYANKVITTGEGGMILCDDPQIAKDCMMLRNIAFESDGPRYVHNEIGFNYRMTNMQAAIGVAQLEQINIAIEKKRSTGKFYNEHLSFLEDYGYQLPIPETSYAENIYWAYSIAAAGEKEKKQTIEHLNKNNIGNRTFFVCMHQQPVFKKMNLFIDDSHLVAESLSGRGFNIPSGLGLTEMELEKIIKVFKSLILKMRTVLVYLILFASFNSDEIASAL